MNFRTGIFFLILLGACSDATVVPGKIIAMNDMEKIIWDMVQTDQFSIQYLKKDSARFNVRMETMKLQDQVFQIHHISKQKFQESLQYYLSHPELTKILFDSLSAKATRLRTEVYRRPVTQLKVNPK
ncbi:MAG: DUF4296 domain-containing protein [Chitinophagales bacterium]